MFWKVARLRRRAIVIEAIQGKLFERFAWQARKSLLESHFRQPCHIVGSFLVSLKIAKISRNQSGAAVPC